MLENAQILQEEELLLRLNNVPNAADAVANDVQYHLLCWTNFKKRALKKSAEFEGCNQEINDPEKILADIEIINIVNCMVRGNEFLDMNIVNMTYNNLLGSTESHINYKRYLKGLLQENVQDISFSRSKSRRDPEVICSNASKDRAVDSFRCIPDEYNQLFEAAKTVRDDILKSPKWTFTGDYTGFEAPTSLTALLKWIIIGPKVGIDLCPKRKVAVDTSVRNLAEILMNSVKTERQVDYQSKTGGFRKSLETPFSVGLGLYMHQKTRSKAVVDTLAQLHLSVPYDKVLQIENDIAQSVYDNMQKNNGVYVPPNLVQNIPVHFAIDNTDFSNDTPDGKHEFHGTGQVVFQKSQDLEVSRLKIHRSKERNLSFQEDLFNCSSTVCFKPTPPNENFPCFSGVIPCDDMELYTLCDRTWATASVFSDDMPTWAGYNSLLSIPMTRTTTQCLPLLPSTPTDWSNLYCALKIVQGINVSVTGNYRTIVTLDLQLYSKCMQLREKDDISENFIFRLGELHVIFAMLKVIGKYISESGVDRLFIEAGMYGSTTLGQIIDGKHMKRGVEAYSTMYLALFSLYVREAVKDSDINWLHITNKIMEITQSLDILHNTEENTVVHERISLYLEEFINEKLQDFNNSLNQQGLFLYNFMVMFESLLLFIRASRQSLWKLHLASLNNFTKYFFAFDQLNYARLTPYYLATMIDLQTEDETSWLYLEDNYSIVKSSIPFVGIGSDHAMEQENKNLKISGGIVGLTQKPATLNRFCLASPITSSLSSEFAERNNINKHIRKQHYQLTGSTNQRIHRNVQKLLDTMASFSVTFAAENDSVYNVVSKAVLPETVANDLLHHQRIGFDLYNEFISDRIQGSLSIWSPMKKYGLKTFKTQMKAVKSKVAGKLFEMKEEKNLMARFLLAARKRPELELEQCIGEYEFSVVPRSLFSADGQPLPCIDKAKLMHHIEEMAGVNVNPPRDVQENSAIIIDGMAVVNQINKDHTLKTCKVI